MSELEKYFDDDGLRRIQVGEYIIIQRQKYCKLTKFTDLETTVSLGKDKLELSGLQHQPYCATFKMCPKDSNKYQKRGNKQRLHTLEICNDESELNSIYSIMDEYESGTDNRHINDVGDSQALDSSGIDQLREEYRESSKIIIEKIVENSKTFQSKTEYSQEKYLQRKERKYFEFIEIREPSIRLLSEIYLRQDHDKMMGLRFDMLSQIVAYSGVCGYGNYLLYESGTNGLLPATLLNSMGSGTEATLVHMHPGNIPQTQAILALQMPKEQTKRCISVNIYSVLRDYYQQQCPSQQVDKGKDNLTENGGPENKKIKFNSSTEEKEEEEVKEDASSNIVNGETKTESWQLENQRARHFMMEKSFDALIVVSKEHPLNIVNELLQFVRASRPIVVFSQYKEVLMELYNVLKSTTKIINLRLTSNWMRSYQVLPNRTHPHVNMMGNSGYLLVGYTVNN